MNTKDAVSLFAECAIGKHESIWNEADSDKANRFALSQIEAVKYLQSKGDVGRDALRPLLFDARQAVRVSAAVFLLRHCTVEALTVLKRESKGTGFLSFEASQALLRWQEGSWALDPL